MSGMARGVRLGSVLSLVCLVACSGSGTSAPRTSASPVRPPGRTNVVVIMTDDQTTASLRMMPEVNALLVRQGTTFANSYSSYPLCCPSRATYLTGQYAHNHGVRYNTPPYGGYQTFRDQSTTFPVALQDSGYTTIHIGKYLNGYGEQGPTTIPPGWNQWDASVDPSTYQYLGYTLNENGKLKKFGKSDSDYQTDVYRQMAVAAVRREVGDPKPFFLNLAVLAPHAEAPETTGLDYFNQVREDASGVKRPLHIPMPRPAPRDKGHFAHEPLPRPPSFDLPDMSGKPKFLQLRPRFDKTEIDQVTADYRAELESLLAVDLLVKDLVGALSDTHQLDSTAIIFTSDNGFFNGEQRIPYGKFLPYEASARVPLVLRGPGIPAGATNNSLVSNVDLAPTILQLASAQPLRTMDGMSLLPLLHPGAQPSILPVLLESGPGGGFANPVYAGLRTVRYKYIEYQTGDKELYDLFTDPDEVHNLIADPASADTRARLAATLNTLRNCAGASCH